MIMDVGELDTVERNVENGHPEVIDAENGEHFEQGKLLPPPTRKFHDREELLEYVHYFSLLQGYATTIRDSKKDQYVTIGCDKGGSYRNRMKTPPEERKRKSSSRLINCPFQIRGVKLVNGSWILRIKDGAHNHEASNVLSGHPSFRLFSKEEILRIKEMSKSGLPSRKILASLRQTNPNLKEKEDLIDREIERMKRQKDMATENEISRPQSSNLTSKNVKLNSSDVTELTNLAGSGGPPVIDRTFPNRQSPGLQNVVSFSPCQDMETLIERTEVSEGEEEDHHRSSSEEKNDVEVEPDMGPRTMEEKIDYAIFLLKEQGKTTKAFMSKETSRRFLTQNPCTNTESEMTRSKYKNMYIDSQKKIDELKDENLDLRKKLETALAALEVILQYQCLHFADRTSDSYSSEYNVRWSRSK